MFEDVCKSPKTHTFGILNILYSRILKCWNLDYREITIHFMKTDFEYKRSCENALRAFEKSV